MMHVSRQFTQRIDATRHYKASLLLSAELSLTFSEGWRDIFEAKLRWVSGGDYTQQVSVCSVTLGAAAATPCNCSEHMVQGLLGELGLSLVVGIAPDRTIAG
jgi:hypothetical protein